MALHAVSLPTYTTCEALIPGDCVQGADSLDVPLVQVADDVADDPRIKSSANANAFATPNDRRKSAVLNADGSEAAEQADQAQSDKPPQVRGKGHDLMPTTFVRSFGA